MSEVRTVFLGNAPWAAVTLEAAIAAADPIVPSLVVTREPRPAGRGSRLRATAVANAARRLSLPLVETPTVVAGPGAEAIATVRPDVLAVVAYGEILPAEVLGLARLGAVNVHFSLLPRWRGASPVQRAIDAGDASTGVTTMLMDEGLDTGPVLARRAIPVTDDDDAGTLGARLAGIGGALLAETIRGLASGTVAPTPQALDGVTYAPKLVSADRVVDWTQAAAAIARRIRALSPSPGATTTFRDQGLGIVRGHPATGDGVPGSIILGPGDGRVEVATGQGRYRLLVVTPAGKRPMDAADWARGARITDGERLGNDGETG